MSYFTLQNGKQLYYEIHGEGSPVVLLHGWTSNHTVYAESVPQISRKAKCILYDHRGHGGSKAACDAEATIETLASDLNELLTGLHLRDVTLIGWSMGAATAMTYIRDYGCGALRQVVLCDMTPRQLNDANWNLGLYQGKYTVDDMAQDAGQPFLKLYQSFAVGAMPRLKRLPGFVLRPILRKRLRACDEPTLRSLSASMKQLDNRDVIGQITVPLTYFYAEPGSLFSPALAKWYESQAKVPFHAVPFPQSSHMFLSEHPEAFAEAVLRLV